MSPQLDNQSYYDEFASWYERDRHYGYHALIDDLETDLVMPYCEGRDVLEVGCGTGLILRRVASRAKSARGVDISPGMLEKAKERGLDVVVGSATELPYDDEVFDTIYQDEIGGNIGVRRIQVVDHDCDYSRITLIAIRRDRFFKRVGSE